MLRFCENCSQWLNEELFEGKSICVYCWAMMGGDHSFERAEIAVFGEVEGITAANIDFSLKKGEK